MHHMLEHTPTATGAPTPSSTQSFWSPYVLPLTPQHLSFDTPLFWSALELEQLRGTSLHMRMQQEEEEQAQLKAKANANDSKREQEEQKKELRFGAVMSTMFTKNVLPVKSHILHK